MSTKYLFMNDQRSMIDVINYISKIHKKNAAKTARDYDLCMKYANISQLLSVGIGIAYYIIAFIYQLPTVFDYIEKGTIRPSLHIYLPGVNEFDTIDMIALLLTNLILAMLGIMVLFASDTFIAINFSTIPMFSTIIRRDIDELENKLKAKKQNNSPELVKEQLVAIIKLHMKYNE